MTKLFLVTSGALLCFTILTGCNNSNKTASVNSSQTTVTEYDTADYFLLRPKLEKEYGYSHAVKIGNDLKISGAVSMDDSGVIVAPGNMEQQMKNCYSDLGKILNHYGYTFDDVVAENVYTTNMEEFIRYLAIVTLFTKSSFQPAPG